jgi:hypothetical protein
VLREDGEAIVRFVDSIDALPQVPAVVYRMMDPIGRGGRPLELTRMALAGYIRSRASEDEIVVDPSEFPPAVTGEQIFALGDAVGVYVAFEEWEAAFVTVNGVMIVRDTSL